MGSSPGAAARDLDWTQDVVTNEHLPEPVSSAGSIHWWEERPMSYDWRGQMEAPQGSMAWFREVESRAFAAIGAYFAHGRDARPFSRLIPYEDLREAHVLEIGCGAGVHTVHLAETAHLLTSIDATAKALSLTRQFLELRQSAAQLARMDAASLAFKDESFDFVWSWGVIHHLPDTERAVSEIARVLTGGGQARVMVYHADSLLARAYLLRARMSGAPRGARRDQLLTRYLDGHIARHFGRAELRDLFQRQFTHVEVRVFGQKPELIPLPGTVPILRRMKLFLSQLIPDALALRLLGRWGHFLFVTAEK